MVPVIIKYVVERDGEEKMTFTSKKEADNYDKMLDIAEQISALIKHAEPTLNEAQVEGLGFALANNNKVVQNLFKGKTFENTEFIES